MIVRRPPSGETLTRLQRWRPRHGVLSVYLNIDPGDRGEAWRIELRNGVAEAVEGAGDAIDRETGLALEATAERIARRFPEGRRPEGRVQVGFVEAAERKASETWYSMQVPARRTQVLHGSGPVLWPLLLILDHGASRGVVAVSAERVRLFDWTLGLLEEVDGWGLEIFSLDWRERRSPRSRDPAREQGTASAGRDQFGQRLDANRDRFLRETGKQTAAHGGARRWRELLAFGDLDRVRRFESGLNEGLDVRLVEQRDVISDPPHLVAARVMRSLDGLNQERERALVGRVRDEAFGGTRGSLGIEETLQALEQGRVGHLLFDAERIYPAQAGGDRGSAAPASAGAIPVIERMVERALETSAAITPLEGEAAEELEVADGVAALLRY